MTTTNFPNGVTNASTEGALGTLTFPDPTRNITYFNDFFSYTAADWTVTETQAGATQAVASGQGGWLVLTNSAADDDVNSIQLAINPFTPSTDKSLWLKVRFKVSDATQSDVLVGLASVDTSPIASLPTTGLFFLKSDGSAVVTAHIRAAGASTTITMGSLTSDTFVDLVMVFESVTEGIGRVSVYQDGTLKGTTTTLTNYPAAAVAPTLTVQNGEAVAKVLTVDTILASLER